VVEQVSASSGEDTNPVRAPATARSRAPARARTMNPVRERATRASATGFGVDDLRGRRGRAAASRGGGDGGKKRLLPNLPSPARTREREICDYRLPKVGLRPNRTRSGGFAEIGSKQLSLIATPIPP
jgi:hypothetical protein